MKKYLGVFVIGLVASMSVAGVALADDHEEAPEATIATPQIIFDEETGTITIGLPLDGEENDCGPEEPGGEIAEGGDDGADPTDDAITDDGDEATTYGPGDCIEFVVDHPSGKMHHGAIVSSVAKNLHPSMLDGFKKGEIMRKAARGEYVEGEGEAVESEPKAKKDKSSKDKAAKDKGGKPLKHDKAAKGSSKVKPGKAKNRR